MWVKIDDLMPEHPKLVQAGALAFALDAAGICYCARHLTDGFVPAGAVPGLLDLAEIVAYGATGEDLRKHLVGRLVDVGRWVPEADGSGWQIHGYLDFNPSAADVERKRLDARERASRGRASRWNGAEDSETQPRPEEVREESAESSRELRAKSERSSMVPYPYPLDYSSSSEVSVVVEPEANLKDDDETSSESAIQNSPEAQERATAAAGLLADDDVKRAESRGVQIQDRKAYKAQCRKERMALDWSELVALSEVHPGWMPRRLANELAATQDEAPAGPTRTPCPHCGETGNHLCEVLDHPFDPDETVEVNDE